jgi:hypothetical protein
MSCLMDDVHATRTLAVARLSVVILAPAMTTDSLRHIFRKFWKQLSFSSVTYGTFNSRKSHDCDWVEAIASSSVSHRSLLHDAPWWWMAGLWMTFDILISKMTFAATNVLVLVYHGFMRPIFVQDLQLILPVPLDLMLMSCKTLQRRWWVAQPLKFTYWSHDRWKKGSTVQQT